MELQDKGSETTFSEYVPDLHGSVPLPWALGPGPEGGWVGGGDPGQSSSLPMKGAGICSGAGWNFGLAASSCVTLGKKLDLSETVSSSLQRGQAHLLLSVVK